ncbi:hypothetical protein UY3_18939 [Chelonia mydas]|uniref:Uncharacterized protein n=1 Tax=Chelonia mydas TaxID=8469 RepID=M7AMQ3_CHEMY|nr:hypothetical protein UY3_18939 [Chelonia mydas]
MWTSTHMAQGIREEGYKRDPQQFRVKAKELQKGIPESKGGAIPECSNVTALDSTFNSDALARCKCFYAPPIISVPEVIAD